VSAYISCRAIFRDRAAANASPQGGLTNCSSIVVGRRA
jgi:hypothetical protein